MDEGKSRLSNDESIVATVEEQHAGLRVDRYIAEVLELFPRSQIAHRNVHVLIDDAEVRMSRKLKAGETVTVSSSAPEEPSIEPEDVPLDVLFESERVIVLNKPAGMVVHPGAGNWHGTLAQGLLYHVRSMRQEFSDSTRPGIVHRLDKETSGVIIAAKDPEMVSVLADQFKRRRAGKQYLALIKGRPPRSSDTIENSLGRDERNRKRFAVVADDRGKRAVTEYRVLRHYPRHAFVLLTPHTGRTHQLRVHMQSIGCPIVGDDMYARKDKEIDAGGMMLHAYRLRIYLPELESWREFVAPIPDAFKDALQAASDLPSGR